MMMARPTAASAAATVMTKNTNTCPAAPYACANATKVRFTALSISSTHMNTMIALRRISTPKTPIVNSTAEKKSASASIVLSALFAEEHRAHDRREQEHARHLERQEILIEQWSGHRRDRAAYRHLTRRESLRQRQIDRRLRFGQRENLRKHGDRDRPAGQLPADASRVGDLALSEVQKHDDEQEHD